MKVWMVTDIIYFEGEEIKRLRRRHIYEIPDYWAKLIVKEECGAGYEQV